LVFSNSGKNKHVKITAAGTVADSHDIPYYPLSGTKKLAAKIVSFSIWKSIISSLSEVKLEVFSKLKRIK
jgi:hypothetical protein